MVVADHNMPGTTGISLCDELTVNRPDLPVVVITAFGSLETAIAAIRAGAYDFLTKPFEIEQLVLTLERALAHRALKQEVKRLRRAVAESAPFGEILGESPAVRGMCDLIARAAASDATVLITGESGTGKDLVARALHERSERRAGPFVAINCAAVHRVAAGERAVRPQAGRLHRRPREPHRACSCRPRAAPSSSTRSATCRWPCRPSCCARSRRARCARWAATPRSPSTCASWPPPTATWRATPRRGGSAQDLFFRINVIQIPVPALRARGNDVLLLAQHFLQRAAARSGKPVTGFSSSAAERLLAYPWPGNVRELQNAVERAVALCAFERIAPEDLPERIRDHRRSQLVVGGDDPSALLPMHEVERRYILHVLDAVGGNKTVAARILGFDRRTMYRKLERFDQQGATRETPPEPVATKKPEEIPGPRAILRGLKVPRIGRPS